MRVTTLPESRTKSYTYGCGEMLVKVLEKVTVQRPLGASTAIRPLAIVANRVVVLDPKNGRTVIVAV